MSSYKCVNCGAVHENGSEYYQVRIVGGEGEERYVPTCTKECATETQKKYVNLHFARMNSVKHQHFQKMKW